MVEHSYKPVEIWYNNNQAVVTPDGKLLVDVTLPPSLPVTLWYNANQARVTADGKLLVETELSGNLPNFNTGTVDVPTAGIPVQMPSITIPEGVTVIICAKYTNVGYIYIGNSSGNANATNGFTLIPGSGIGLKIDNLSKVWVNSTVNGEGVMYIFEQT
jgi:hypothetical protein